jgi:hypothetical protein
MRTGMTAGGGGGAGVLTLPSTVRIYLCARPVDLRKSFDGLAVATREVIGEDPLCGHVFVFLNRRGDRLSEVESATWADFDLEGGWVRLRGTKTSSSDRRVPIPTSIVPILEAFEVRTGPVVERWLNVRRDLANACRRAGIAAVTPNDLRRTFASWMKQQGEDSAVVAKLMGHSSTRMVDLVYGRLNEENYRTAAGRLPSLDLPEPGSKWVANPARTGRTRRAGRGSTVTAVADTHGAENSETQGTLQSSGLLMFERDEVPGPGIEPGTRGFSGLVREWPRPRDPLEKRRRRAGTEAHLCQPDAGSGQLDFGFEDPGRPAG